MHPGWQENAWSPLSSDKSHIQDWGGFESVEGRNLPSLAMQRLYSLKV